MKTKVFYIVVWVATLFVLTSPVFAQSGNFNFVDSLAKFEAIPTDPVFDMLGVSKGQISQPGTPSGLLASALNVADATGKLKPAVALSFAPYQLFGGSNISLADYVKDFGTRLLCNSQISIGTAPTQRVDSSLDYGIGIRIVLFNTGDGRLNQEHMDTLVERAKALLLKGPPLPKPGQRFTPAQRTALATALANNVTDANSAQANAQSAADASERWNSNFLEIDAGAVGRGSNSYISKSAFDRAQIWVNGGFGLSIFQLQLQIGGIWRNPNKEFYGPDSANSLVSALQLRAGGPSFRLGLGCKLLTKANDTFAGSAEVRLADKSWFVISLSREFAPGMDPGPWTPSVSIRSTMGS